MRVVIHVAAIEDVPAARTEAEASLQAGDELEIIVGEEPIRRAAESQPLRPAVGYAAQSR